MKPFSITRTPGMTVWQPNALPPNEAVREDMEPLSLISERRMRCTMH